MAKSIADPPLRLCRMPQIGMALSGQGYIVVSLRLGQLGQEMTLCNHPLSPSH